MRFQGLLPPELLPQWSFSAIHKVHLGLADDLQMVLPLHQAAFDLQAGAEGLLEMPKDVGAIEGLLVAGKDQGFSL